MCLLCFYPRDVDPDFDDLEIGAANNPDGFGYAILTKKRNLLVRRSMDPDYLLLRFMQDRGKHHGPALFHARRGTSGTKTLFNCHPFQVGRDGRTVIAHNGVLFRPPTTENRCDTHVFAEDVMPVTYRAIDRPRERRRLERQIGGSKIVLLTGNRRYQKSYYIFNEHLGHWTEDGAWMSNGSYKERRSYVAPCAQRPAPITRTKDGVTERSYDGGQNWWPVYQGGGTQSSFPAVTRGTKRYGYCRWCKTDQVVEPYTKLCTVCRICTKCEEWARKCTCKLSRAMAAAGD